MRRRLYYEFRRNANRLCCQTKKGLHFTLAFVIIWCAVLAVHLTSMPILTKYLLTFCFTAPLMQIAYMISKIIKVDFTNKANPLTNLGVLFSLNQMLYLLFAMWIYPTFPEKMIMVLAMIFGAHLMHLLTVESIIFNIICIGVIISNRKGFFNYLPKKRAEFKKYRTHIK